MWISRSLFVLILEFYYAGAMQIVNHDYNNINNTLVTCIKKMFQLYYKDESLTFVHLNAWDLDILQALHETNSLSIITRRPYKKIKLPHRGYLIYTLTAEDFLTQFFYLLAETTWMPYAPFLVVVERLEVDKLQDMFDELLRVHVADVVIIDAITTYVYTYDPFEKQGCGKRFDKIIKLGMCRTDKPPDFSSNKSLRDLRNCTLQVAATHWPPFTIDATQTDVKTTGMDEYVFYMLGEVEHININFTYIVELSDVVSFINEDMVATGPLRWLQVNKFDAVTGSQVLLPEREVAFTYLCGHTITIDDYFKIFVQKSRTVSGWYLLVRVFKPLVWLLLLLTLIAVIILILVISKTKDRTRVVFDLIDNLLMHNCRVRRINELFFILLFWIVFACLIGYHYLTVLYSFTTKPVPEYQIDEVSDLIKNEMRPCMSAAVRSMQTLTSSSLDIYEGQEETADCLTLTKSLGAVAKSDNLYTVIPYSMYYADRYKYYNKYGKSQLHSLSKPLSKIIYASYLYKGFPLYDKFNLLTMHISAAGLTSKVWRDYDYSQKRRYLKGQLSRKITMTVPWYIIVLGYGVSSLCFLGELITNHFKKLPRIPPA